MRRPQRSGRTRAAALLTGGACLVGLLAGCGQEEFKNVPRPAVPMQLSGVITQREVEVSPARVGAGPVIVIVSNQTDQSHTVTLEGDRLREMVGPINPGDTATIQATLTEGEYEMKAGSERAVAASARIRPAELVIAGARPTGEDELLLP